MSHGDLDGAYNSFITVALADAYIHHVAAGYLGNVNCTLNTGLDARRRYPVLLYPVLDHTNIFIHGLGLIASPRLLFRRQRARQRRFLLGLPPRRLGRQSLALHLFLSAPLFFGKALPFGFARSFFLRFALPLKFRQPLLLQTFRLLPLHSNLFQPLLLLFKLPAGLLGLLFGLPLLLERQPLLLFPEPLLLLLQLLQTRHLLANERLVDNGRLDGHLFHGRARQPA